MKKFTITLDENFPTDKGLQVLEASYIEYVHTKAKYNQSRTARMLKMSRGTLRTKLNEYFPGVYL